MNIFSPDKTAKVVHDTIPEPVVPSDEVEIGAKVTSQGDVGIQGRANADIGKPGGWSVLAEGSWMRKAGGAITGWFKWKPKP